MQPGCFEQHQILQPGVLNQGTPAWQGPGEPAFAARKVTGQYTVLFFL